MSVILTDAALEAVKSVGKNPNLILEIDGVGVFFGAVPIRKYIATGDDNIVVGDPLLDLEAFYIGGFNLLANQESVMLLDGTSTSIKQSLNVDKGEGASVSNMAIALLDDGTITELITPGVIVDDILQRKCRIWLGFEQTAFPNDYFILFRGVVTDVQASAGKVVFQINSPDDKKRSNIYKRVETKLTSSITNSNTTITLDLTANILTKVLGPDATYDSAFKSYVVLGDEELSEIIEFDSISGFDLVSCTRGQLGTVPNAWPAGTNVATFYRLTDDAVPLALKVLFSGTNGDYSSDVECSSFNIAGDATVSNAIYFNNKDVANVHGLVVGDFITTTGAINGANNVTLKPILEIVNLPIGSYIVVDGVSFVDEGASTATIATRSQYDTLPDGLRMAGDEVDVEEHLRLYRLFLSSDQYDIYIKDTIENSKEYLEKTIYSPIGCYSLPRKSKASVGYHIGPIPGQNIVTLNSNNIKNPGRQRLRRTTNSQFYNEIIYKYEEDSKTDRFLSNLITISATSKNRILGSNKTLIIDAKGFRDNNDGAARAQLHSNRRLKRYEFAAEVLSVDCLFETGFNLEIGDIVIYDGANLKISDTRSGAIDIAPRFYEIQNKEFNLKSGDVSLEMVDTSFATSARYCLIGHSSNILSGISTTKFVIEESYASIFGSSEYRKWNGLPLASVRIRSLDLSINENSVIVDVTGNTITISPALTFTPSSGMIMEMAEYNDPDLTDQVALIYAHMSPLNGGADTVYSML